MVSTTSAERQFDPSDLKRAIEGVMAFAVTPFASSDGLDVQAIEDNAKRLVESGASSIVVAGGVGEFYALTPAEHRTVVEATARVSDGRIPVIAGIGHSTRIAVDLARNAAQAGASGLMVNPPYFVEVETVGLCRHYREIGEATGLGIVVFQTKSLPYSLEDLWALSEVDEVVAVKDEVGDISAFIEAREALGDRFVWINGMAETHAVPYFAAGASTITSGVINFAPHITMDVWNTGKFGDMKKLEALVASKIRPISHWRSKRKGYSTTVIKEAMNLLGLPGGDVRLPLVPMTEDERAGLLETLRSLGLTSDVDIPS